MEALARAMPLQGFAGGLMIGVAAAVVLLGAGRIAGVSGLAARAVGLTRSTTPRILAIAFILGLPFGAFAVNSINGSVVTNFPNSPLVLVAGGLLVGFGTRLGAGCTSGHGVCGVSRLSRRSLAATGVFMAAGMASVAAMNALGASW